jgi:hypothetical protein
MVIDLTVVCFHINTLDNELNMISVSELCKDSERLFICDQCTEDGLHPLISCRNFSILFYHLFFDHLDVDLVIALITFTFE